MNKKLVLYAAISSIFGMSAIVVSVPSFAINNVFALGTRTNNTTHIVLNNTNQPNITSGSGSLTYNGYAHFSYVGASSNATGHVSLADNGELYKNEASNSLSSFLVSFSGNLILHTGYNGVDDTCYEYTLESGVSTDVRGNYFKLISSGATDIESIDISFGCVTEDSETHTPSSDWTHNETKHWHECEDPNCVRKLDEANHVEADIPMVAPTKTSTGLYNGKECSVCHRVLVEPTILPMLSATDYNISYRTAMIDDEVRDSETYTLKSDPLVSFDIGYGDTVYTEYIHAGTSYYSLNRWNELFPNQEADFSVSEETGNKTLTITLNGDTTVTAESGGALDGQLDLMLYDSVVVTGNGELTVEYAAEIDGIEAWNLEIQEGATLNLIGFNETRKTGFKVYGTLQIDGTANVTKYGYAVGFNADKDGSSDKTFALNIGATGELNIDQARDGIHVWGTPTGGCRFNISGKLNIDADEDAMQFETQVFTYFKDNARVTLNAVGAGIYNHDENGSKNPDNRFWFQNTAEVTITTTQGCGIKLGNTGRIYVQDSSKLNIEAGSSGINGYQILCVCDGNQDNYSKNNASLIVKSHGLTSGTHAMTSNVNPIGARGNDWCATLFNTDGEVLIEKLGTRGSTGIHLGGKKSSDLHFRLLCSNMTIKNCSNAIGCWVAANFKLTYTYDGNYSKLNVVDCNNIINNDASSTIKNKFTSSTVNVVTTQQ